MPMLVPPKAKSPLIPLASLEVGKITGTAEKVEAVLVKLVAADAVNPVS